MTKLLAYHNDPAIKAKYVQRFAQHRAADDVIQGTGYANGRGCFVGCTLERYEHKLFQIELGWPEWLARLADTIFEGLPKDQAPQFGTDLLDAVPVGVDLELARVPLLIRLQRRNLSRLDSNTEPYAEQCRTAIRGVIAWLEQGADPKAWSAAQSAAWSAWSAAESAAESAWSARWAARSAAEAQHQRDDLLALIKELKA